MVRVLVEVDELASPMPLLGDEEMCSS